MMRNYILFIFGIIGFAIIPTLISIIVEKIFNQRASMERGYGSYIDHSDQKDEVINHVAYDNLGRTGGG